MCIFGLLFFLEIIIGVNCSSPLRAFYTNTIRIKERYFLFSIFLSRLDLYYNVRYNDHDTYTYIDGNSNVGSHIRHLFKSTAVAILKLFLLFVNFFYHIIFLFNLIFVYLHVCATSF